MSVTRLLIICTLILGSLSAPVLSQSPADWWYFGTNAGMHFTAGVPVAVTNSQMAVMEGCASVSDDQGNLLFYTDGVTVWNANHLVMTNGNGLMGHSSSTQSAIILRKPGSQTLYYIFTVPISTGSGLRYSIVDMTQSGGLGAVDAINKNILVTQPVGEKLTAVKHGNGIDFWVLCVQSNSTIVKAFHLSATGLNTTAVNSVSPVNFATGVGYMKGSHNGQMVAAAISEAPRGMVLWQFNNLTGALNNPIHITAAQFTLTYSNIYGVEFSPNDSLLYASDIWRLHQFDVTTWTNAAIAASMFPVFTATQIADRTYALQVAPDGKIYNARIFQTSLGVINNPNVPGAGCNYIPTGQNLGNKQSFQGLPQFFKYDAPPQIDVFFSCQTDSTYFEIDSAGIDSVFWNFDDPSTGSANESSEWFPYHVFSDTGYFNVQLVAYSDSTPDTLYKLVHIKPRQMVDLGNDTALCVGLEIAFDVHQPYSTYLWSTGSTDSAITVTSDSSVAVTVFGVCDTISDTVNIDWYYPFEVDLGGDTSICTYNVDTISTGLASTLFFTWNTGNTQSDQYVADTGTYTVTVSDGQCTYSDTVHYAYHPEVSANLGNDSIACYIPSVTLNPVTINAVSYAWSNDSVTSTIDISATGTYTVTVSGIGGHCKAVDSVHWILWFEPTVNLANDTSICRGDSILIQAMASSPNPITYLWNNGSTKNSLAIRNQGLYWVNVFDQNCSMRDSIIIDFYPELLVSLGNDTSVCPGDSLRLTPFSNDSLTSFVWQDYSTQPTLSVTDHGTYAVTVSNGLCRAHDQKNVFFYPSPKVNLGPDTAICPHDEITLNATHPAEVVTYRWMNGQAHPVQTFAPTDSSFLWVETSNGVCSYKDSVFVSYRQLPKATPSNDTSICYGDEITLSIAPLESTVSSHYQWETGVQGQQVMISDSGYYSVSINDGSCEKHHTIYVSLVPEPTQKELKLPSEICEGEQISVSILDSLIRRYRWSDGSTSPYFLIDREGSYWYEAFHACGVMSDTFNLKTCECYVYMPNAFSPTGNAKNDEFAPVYDCTFSEYQLSVYDRWGELLFFSTDPSNSWNGMYKNVPAQPGVYTWKLSYESRHNKEAVIIQKHGSVTLLH